MVVASGRKIAGNLLFGTICITFSDMNLRMRRCDGRRAAADRKAGKRERKKTRARRSFRQRLKCFLLVLLVLLVALGIWRGYVRKESLSAELNIVEETDDSGAPLLSVSGEINPYNGQKLLAALQTLETTAENFQPGAGTLLIRENGGGETGIFIRIASEIYRLGLRLEVEGYCMSSCFNYLVPAARQIHLRPGALLGFHGSAETTANELPPLKLLYRSKIRQEREFLDLLGQPRDMYIVLRRQMDDFLDAKDANRSPESEGREPYEGGLIFWMVGPDFFERYGLPLTADSYFPRNQEELDRRVARLIAEKVAEKGSETRLYMKGNSFSR